MNFRKLSHVFYDIHSLQEQYITPINIFQENYSFSERYYETDLFFTDTNITSFRFSNNLLSLF